MIMNNYIHILLMIITILSSCSNNKDDIESSSKKPVNYSYISCYLTSIDSLKTAQTKQNDKLRIDILAKGETELYSSLDFSRIAYYYGDTTYNNNEWLETNIQILADSIKEINLYDLCNTPQSDRQNLNTSTEIVYQSYYSFIKSNYNTDINVNDSCSLEYFNKINAKLLSSDFSLSINPELLNKNTKLFEIEIKLHSGKICKKTIEISE